MLATRNSGRSYGSGVKILWLHDWVPTQNRSEKKPSVLLKDASSSIYKFAEVMEALGQGLDTGGAHCT
jgi:hypothetical protein